MVILYILGFLLVVHVWMVIGDKIFRAVDEAVPVSQLLGEPQPYIRPPLRSGCDGARIIVYHKPSATMVQVAKSLSPALPLGLHSWRDGVVGLRVIKSSVPEPPSAGGQWWVRAFVPWRMITIGSTVYVNIPYWRLPSPYEGDILEEVDCGASLSKVETAVERIISEDPAFSEHPFVDWWCEKGRAGRRLGKFDDDGSGK